MEKFNLGLIETLKVDETGWVNPVFFINNEYVFRFNARDMNLPKLQREQVAYKLLREHEIIVPDILAFDDSKHLSPFDVMITKKFDGNNLEADWQKIDVETRSLLAFQAGQILKTIHSVNLNYFGDLISTSPLSQTNNWYDFLENKIKFHLNEAGEISLFEKTQTDLIWNAFNNYKYLLQSVIAANLVHVDFQFGNLLYKDSKITGVLDFEWAFAGDPLYDFCSINYLESTCPGSKKSFLKGYGIGEFDPDALLKIKIYQMIRNIELCIVARKYFSSEESEDFLNVTLNQINSLQKV